MKKGMFNIWGSRYSQGHRKRRYKEEKGGSTVTSPVYNIQHKTNCMQHMPAPPRAQEQKTAFTGLFLQSHVLYNASSLVFFLGGF
ncbi:hypothetical protein QR685DRAFT_270243 [Neurospora intermedia]|uniref:Uncharacterized protein n=1 Tax=Neurospora intermedia TaxID=5142 RepID=A0ABR3DEF7_NEUIN